MSPSFSLLLSIALLGCARTKVAPAAYPDIEPGRYVKTLDAGAFSRRYILRVPQAYDKTKPTPLVVMLHGYSGTADRVERTSGIAEEAERRGWISIFPDGVGDPKGWNAGFINLTGKQVDDVDFLGKMLDEVERTVNVDARRVYVTGHSNGAMMAHRLASRMSGRIAAIAPVAGIVGITKASMIGKPTNPVSVLMIHGSKDQLVGYDANASALLRGIPVYEGAKWWAKAVGASDSPVTTKEGALKIDTWTLGKNGAEVRLVTIHGGGHDWPSKARLGAETAAMILDFFQVHPKQP